MKNTEMIVELTEQERLVLSLLAESWNAYIQLDIEHTSDLLEFQQAIHQAENIIMSRPIMRELDKKDKKSQQNI